MIFKQLKLGMLGNFSYIIGNSGEAAVVDPGWNYKTLIEKCEDLKITKILLTHSHYDHVHDLKKIVKETGAEVFMHEDEDYENKNIKINRIKDNEIIKIGNLDIKVIHTPGHSPGSCCFLIERFLLTGDTLFVGAIGRVDLLGSSEEDMIKSLKKLSELDDDIEVYPGHDYGPTPFSTIGEEKQNNPYIRNLL